MKKRFIGVLVAVIVMVVAILFFLWKTGAVFKIVADSTYNSFRKDNITYSEAIAKINDLGANIDGEEYKNKFSVLNESKTNYGEGTEYIEKGRKYNDKAKYASAFEAFKKVISDDINYESAQEFINECKDNLFYTGTEIPDYGKIINVKPLQERGSIYVYDLNTANITNSKKFEDTLNVLGWTKSTEEYDGYPFWPYYEYLMSMDIYEKDNIKLYFTSGEIEKHTIFNDGKSQITIFYEYE